VEVGGGGVFGFGVVLFGGGGGFIRQRQKIRIHSYPSSYREKAKGETNYRGKLKNEGRDNQTIQFCEKRVRQQNHIPGGCKKGE